MTAKQLNERRERVGKMIPVLSKLFPDAKIVLRYHNNWELLVAVILSAQCTDKKVNEVTDDLFRKYTKPSDYLRASVTQFEQDIRPTGFYHNKAKNILAAAKVVEEKFGGEIPRTMEEILTIPGVARKTANVVLGNAYGVVEGIAVDTHVRRLSIKMGLTDSSDPVKIERDLMEIVPRKHWFKWTYWLIEYGRQICPARPHPCEDHPLSLIYPPAANIWPGK